MTYNTCNAKRLVEFLALALVSTSIAAQSQPSPTVMVVNMVPRDQSDETTRDSEPSIAVNPANVQQIAGAAFTPDRSGANHAPIYVSTDGGMTWKLNPIIPFNDPTTGTGDITLRFASKSNILYVAALQKGPPVDHALRILRTSNFAGSPLMQIVRQGDPVDQPRVQAVSVPSGNTTEDRLVVGYAPMSTAATILTSPNGSATTPSFSAHVVNPRGNCGEDGPVRPAMHPSGRIYGAFFRNHGSGFNCQNLADLVAVRDDNWGTGGFTALKDPADNHIGMVVARNLPIPYLALLGDQRLGSQAALAVDPSNPDRLYLAWADGTASAYTIHLRNSIDGGKTWSADLVTRAPATNPSVAINSRGKVAFLYQKHNGANWETWLELNSDDFASAPFAILLHRAPPLGGSAGAGPLGDYNDVMSVGKDFYGVFSGNNTPDMANFPSGVKYQRNADFTSKSLLKASGTGSVTPSMDPFFFAVREPVLDVCRVRPALCNFSPDMERGLLKLRCQTPGCVIVDPIPRNCQVKYSCPGCRSGMLCPPYYHLRLDGLEKAWDVSLVDSNGNEVEHRISRARGHTIVSFRPSQALYSEGEIGSYQLVFEMRPEGQVGRNYRVKAGLARSSRASPPKR